MSVAERIVTIIVLGLIILAGLAFSIWREVQIWRH